MPTNTTTECYVYVLHDFEPGAMPGVAYRYDSKLKEVVKCNTIRCPHCGAELFEVGPETKVELFCNPEKAGLICTLYHPCKSCGNKTGFKLI